MVQRRKAAKVKATGAGAARKTGKKAMTAKHTTRGGAARTAAAAKPAKETTVGILLECLDATTEWLAALPNAPAEWTAGIEQIGGVSRQLAKMSDGQCAIGRPTTLRASRGVSIKVGSGC
jgi:hypothetical protein